ncbi:MAG: sigma-54 dependent transcriptional regulator [Candidatus Eisenbacteria bacterium]|nr:sigma-54 dependent transcriptional regulator [Candidatus Eisenbacteria bacterium]
MSRILCIDDEPLAVAVLEDYLAKIGHQAVLTSSVGDALKVIQQQPFDLIISDARMPGASGLDLLDQLREEGQEIPVILTTGYASVEHAVQSMRRGAIDYLTKPFRFEALRLAVNNALEVCRLRRENENYEREIRSLRGERAIVGESKALRKVMDILSTVAPTGATVLLQGESGTGKELFARAIHEQSSRREAPFITVNCAALPEGLVESTLFGHERGAFTGATARFPGAFERAHGGTLLLDEVSEMRPELQAKLLRVLQEQEFERVGGQKPVKVDVRIVATTNRDLKAEIEAGRFRQDLYYRLCVMPVRTPPLRERMEDLPLLVKHFVEQAARELGVKAPSVPERTLQTLRQHEWPGNIRELQNAVERAVILTRSGSIEPESFGLDGFAAPGGDGRRSSSAKAVLNLKDIERITIEKALEATGGNRARAAKLLGISERTLRNKLHEYEENAV